jgi:hypothetical protein
MTDKVANLALEFHVNEVAEEVAFWCPWVIVEVYEDAPIIAVTARDEGQRRLEYRIRIDSVADPILLDIVEKVPVHKPAMVRAVNRARGLVQEIAEGRLLPEGVVVRWAGGCVVIANAVDGQRFVAAPDGWTPSFLENGHHDEHASVAHAIADVGAGIVTDPDPADPYGERWDR